MLQVIPRGHAIHEQVIVEVLVYCTDLEFDAVDSTDIPCACTEFGQNPATIIQRPLSDYISAFKRLKAVKIVVVFLLRFMRNHMCTMTVHCD
jgi:hypothetical protein